MNFSTASIASLLFVFERVTYWLEKRNVRTAQLNATLQAQGGRFTPEQYEEYEQRAWASANQIPTSAEESARLAGGA